METLSVSTGHEAFQELELPAVGGLDLVHEYVIVGPGGYLFGPLRANSKSPCLSVPQSSSARSASLSI
jgi:hypothetical protein